MNLSLLTHTEGFTRGPPPDVIAYEYMCVADEAVKHIHFDHYAQYVYMVYPTLT